MIDPFDPEHDPVSFESEATRDINGIPTLDQQTLDSSALAVISEQKILERKYREEALRLQEIIQNPNSSPAEKDIANRDLIELAKTRQEALAPLDRLLETFLS